MAGPTVQEIVKKTSQFLNEKGFESARLESELLIAEALNWERLQVFLKHDYPLSPEELARCREYVRRRALGEPTAYITGKKAFYKETFVVNSSTLIPRPETEELVEHAIVEIDRMRAAGIHQVKVCDLGTGSGCIGLSIQKEKLAGVSVVLVDVSQEALQTAKLNAENLNVSDLCQLIHADVETESDRIGTSGSFDIVVANPPYIDPDDQRVEANVRKFEPGLALFSGHAGEGGLKSLQIWSSVAYNLLKSGGLWLFEMGDQQAEAMCTHLQTIGFADVKVIKDLSGKQRMISARK